MSAVRVMGHLPHLPVGLFPTPLQALPALSAHLGGPRVLAKREDLSGLGAGGNKARKLGYLLADARERGATVVLTSGGPQSNHCAQTACAAARLGLPVELFLSGDDPGARTGNLRVAALVDARLVFTGVREIAPVREQAHARAADLRRAGEVPYVIDLGGSDPLSTAGYVSGVEEVARQMAGGAPPTHMVVAVGSVGTLAGLILGTWVVGVDCRVDGMSVLWSAARAGEVLEGILATARDRYFPDARRRANYTITDAYLGEGYGWPTDAGRAASRTVARLEGILLDQTYTAKAMAGLIDGCRTGRYGAGDVVVFWHTGGLGGFFA